MSDPSAAILAAIEIKADKQLQQLLKDITPLADGDVHLFLNQMTRLSRLFGWPNHIMNHNGDVDDMSDDARAALDENDPADLKVIFHIRNAHYTILKSCDGHNLQGRMENFENNRPRMALDVIKLYHIPKTGASVRNQSITFHGDTQANTSTTVLEWVNKVRRNAQNLVQAGGTVNQEMQQVALVGGLLPEFDTFKLLLDSQGIKSRIWKKPSTV